MTFRAFTFAVLTMLMSGASPIAQRVDSPAPAVRFEAASVRVTKDDDGVGGASFRPGGHYVAQNATLAMLLMSAYRFEDYRIVGVPTSMANTRYTVVASADPQVLKDPKAPGLLLAMLRNLLEERFGLAVHTEKRVIPTYAVGRVSEARLGEGLVPNDVDCKTYLAKPQPPPPLVMTKADFERIPTCGVAGGAGMLFAGGMTMADFIAELSRTLHTVVTDHTGLTGTFNIKLKWSDPLRTGADLSLPDLPGALRDQLGLTLDRRKEPIDVLIVDHVRPPDAN